MPCSEARMVSPSSKVRLSFKDSILRRYLNLLSSLLHCCSLISSSWLRTVAVWTFAACVFFSFETPPPPGLQSMFAKVFCRFFKRRPSPSSFSPRPPCRYRPRVRSNSSVSSSDFFCSRSASLFSICAKFSRLIAREAVRESQRELCASATSSRTEARVCIVLVSSSPNALSSLLSFSRNEFSSTLQVEAKPCVASLMTFPASWNCLVALAILPIASQSF
mmetsp:Transcript_15424/g.30754  ORF Transcript_15424/g.30754 Transcript_15424/m.30754 type:complete len:220 (-) Transcript_15424:265-924(-)